MHEGGVCCDWVDSCYWMHREGHLVTPTMLWSLWSAVSVAVVVCRGDWMLAAQHFQPRLQTSEKEIWVAEMEGLLPSYLQSPLPVQHHPRYSIWEPVCVWCLRCMWVLGVVERGNREGGKSVCGCVGGVTLWGISGLKFCQQAFFVYTGTQMCEYIKLVHASVNFQLFISLTETKPFKVCKS